MASFKKQCLYLV